MAFSYLRGTDTVSGKEGKATAVINGKVTELFMIKSFEGSMEKEKTPIKAIGSRVTQHKTIGWEGKGSMTMYYLTPEFRALALQYAKTGIDSYITVTVTNEDPGSSVGKQTLIFYNVNVDTQVLAKLSDEVLEEDTDFTFEDFDILDSFNKPVLI
jgi:hypothetical protein